MWNTSTPLPIVSLLAAACLTGATVAPPAPDGKGMAGLTQQLAARCGRADGAVGVVAIAVLKEVEQGRLSLDRKVRVTPADAAPGWQGNTDLWRRPVQRTVRELLELALVRSDNTSNDLLFRLVGGPETVHRRMQALGFRGLHVRSTVRQFVAQGGKPNTGTPEELVRLLARLQEGRLLRPPHRALVLGCMTRTLPAGTPVADKTGTGGPDQATNDVGLITLPGRRGHLAMAVLVTGSKSPTEAQEALIADLARIAYDWCTAQAPNR
jgi:beta-lactamase class A